MRVALIDHYDSFCFNVLDWLRRGGLEVERVAYDDAPALATLRASPLPLVLSPGPKRPEDAPPTLALAGALLGRQPILGICLGHQMLAHLAGAAISPGVAPFHGSTRRITPLPGVAGAPGLLAGLAPFRAAVYNSLVVAPATLRAPWRVSAVCELGEVAAIERIVPGEAVAYGIQFHPESFLSEGADLVLDGWLRALAAPCP